MARLPQHTAKRDSDAEIAANENGGKDDSHQSTQADSSFKEPVSLAKKAAFPGFIPPMLATLAAKPLAEEGWIHEIKLDGYRLIAAKKSDEVRLYSRRENSFTDTYAHIARQLESFAASFVLDGEICHMSGEHRSDFQKLQRRQEVDAERLNYFIFDLLWLNGHDLTALPLIERKKLLGVLLTDSPPNIHYLKHDEGEAQSFFRQMQKKHTEGMITKRKNSVYSAGIRSRDWLKIKTGHRQEMVICGYMPSDKEQRALKSLLCAVYEGENLVYSGKVGTGFSRKSMAEIREKLDSLETDTIEIDNFPGKGSVRWVEPRLVCEVGFSGWTKDGLMRHPRFIALRREKDPEEIGFERGVEPVRSQGRLQLTNLDKIFWPREGYSKGDTLAYYRDVAAIILPYIKNRPQSLHRMPDGIDGQSFFQKNVNMVPSWVETASVQSSSGKEIDYLLCQDTDTLLYTVNLGCIELNPWNSILPDLEHPDYMVFDLDPVEVSFATLVEVALRFKKLFDTMQMESFCKTSGSRGLHIYLPIEPHYSHNQVQRFVREVGAHINRSIPETTSLRRDPAARRGKVYLDYLQNGRGKTMASVYSLRPQPGAPVSAPLKWSELTPGLDPAGFNLQNMRRRLDRYGDLWSDFYQSRADLEKVLADTTIPMG